MAKFLILFLSTLILISCNKKQENKAIDHASKQYSSASPQVTVLADLPDSLKPKTILLATTPKPKRIEIPDRPITLTIQKQSATEIIHLGATEKTKAEFSSAMQNYTTDQGLAVDVISCSYADKKGNLWFGTFTAGISKYDGKSFTNYTTSQGLISNGIKCIMEDKTGNLWFGTDDGVSKFDGITFSCFGNFKKVTVNSILEDRDGNFWFGTESNGLYKYTGNSINKYSKSDGLQGNYVYALKEDSKGALWIGTENGLCKYDEKGFTNIALNNEAVHAICIDRSGNIWAGTTMGYIKYNGEDITNYPFNEGIVPFVFEDRAGSIWLTAGRGGILFYNDNSFSHLNNSNGVIIGEIHSITEDNAGNLWLSSAANGVFNYSGLAFQRLTYASIRSIFEDKNGDLWFAGYGGGFTKFDGTLFTNFKLTIPFWSLFQDKSGNIWLGSEYDGLIKFDGKSFTFYTDLNGLTDNSVMSIMQDSKGNLWIGTRKGVSKFDGASFTNFTKRQGLAGDYVSAILEDNPGELMISTDGGLSHFDGKFFTNYSISQRLVNNDIKSIIKDKNGNLWIGTYGGGLSRYDGKSFYTYTTEHGLPDNVVTQVALSKEGNIVLGTNNGIAILTGFKSVSAIEANNSNSQYEMRNYSAQNNLSNGDLKNYAPIFEIYNSKTGYPVKDVNRGQNTIFLDSKGTLWIATGSEKSGLMRFDYSSLYKNNNPPALNILAVKVDNELVCWRDLLNTEINDQKPKSKFDSIAIPASVTEEVTTFGRTLSNAQREELRMKYKDIEFDAVSKFYPVPQNLKLPHSHNNITIEFSAIEPDKPLLVQYQYKLEGYDNTWSTPANITSASFGNIYEGTYQFKVKALSPSGIWSEPVTYTFSVLPPWWRTWWSYTMYVLLLLSSLRLFVKWRERNLQIEKEKLEKTVESRTAEVLLEKKKSDDLLLNILPHEVAEELKANGSAEAKQFDEVTVLFTDFKNFTKISEKMTPKELVEEIHTCFKAFDTIITKYGIEKIKTIGDSYMCVGGLPVANKTHATDVVSVGMEIQQFILKREAERTAIGKEPFQIRIGIHTGPVVAGIVGIKKFAYDIWGDTVNTASRMESSGEAGEVNISETTFELVKDKFKCTPRGKIMAKHKGEMEMYFVEGRV